MKKVPLLFLIVMLASISGVSILGINTASADSFNQNRVIDDGIFDNTSTMNASQINSFLNLFPNSCISTNNGFSAPDPTGYNPTNGYLYGNPVSAGQVIYDAAQAYGLNPQVILSTLQKEEGTVVGNGPYGCSALALSAVAGYACTDSDTASHTYTYTNGSDAGTLSTPLFYSHGTAVNTVTNTCVNSPLKAGFTEQVIRATWLLKFGQQRSRGNVNWAVIKGNWNNSDDPQTCYGGPMTQGTWQRCPSGATTYYDGYTTIDATAVHMDTGGTAALYWYTPHFPGNQSFDIIFTQWFGGIYAAPYYASYSAQSSYPSLDPGQQTAAYISYQNNGANAWYDDTGLASAPAGTYPVHLAASNPINRCSDFGSSWSSCNRPANTFAAVYEPDGTTLATNQHVAQPGQIVKFGFILSAPSSINAGAYKESFQPIAEGSSSGLFGETNTYLVVNVNPKPAVAWVDQSAYPTIAPSLSSDTSFRIKNTGNTALYDDVSVAHAPANTLPLHLATTNPINRCSAFDSSWPSCNRIANTFAGVYEPNGTTLAADQHLAQPGQIVKFGFRFSVPVGYASGNYTENLQPILEGSPDGGLPNLGAYFTITVPSVPTVRYSQLPSTVSLTANEPRVITYQIENTGNATLPSITQIYTDNASDFKSPAWQTNNVIGTVGAPIAPGQTLAVNVPLLAPPTAKSVPINLSLVDSTTGIAVLGSKTSMPTTVLAPYYKASYTNQTSYPSLTYDQIKTVAFSYQNKGNQPWYDDTSLPTATWRSPYPIHLATAQSLNRCSGFDYQWPSCNRAANTFTSVYEADGTTLAANQHVAQPGQIVKFGFQVQPQGWVPPATYREYFQPIVEGTPDGLINTIGTFQDMSVVTPINSADFSSESSFPAITAGSTSTIHFDLINNGNVSWYDDTSVPNGRYPVHLATSGPINRVSAFSSNWPSASRPVVNFSKVFESNGITLASNQHVATPGQIARLEFELKIPSGTQTGYYKEYFTPILEGAPENDWNMNLTVWMGINVN